MSFRRGLHSKSERTIGLRNISHLRVRVDLA